MNAKDVLNRTISVSERVVQSYLADLTDADLLMRPVDGMNHIAYQLGHLISTERHFIELVQPGSCPPLPEGFDRNYTKDNHTSNDAKQFLTKGQYLDLWHKQREATKKVINDLPESRLDETDEQKYPPFAPSVGAILNLIAFHPIMHAGQWVAVRRKLNKPVAI